MLIGFAGLGVAGYRRTKSGTTKIGVADGLLVAGRNRSRRGCPPTIVEAAAPSAAARPSAV